MLFNLQCIQFKVWKIIIIPAIEYGNVVAAIAKSGHIQFHLMLAESFIECLVVNGHHNISRCVLNSDVDFGGFTDINGIPINIYF